MDSIKIKNRNGLTEIQEKILKFIEDNCKTTGVAPSYREIQEHFGFKAIGSVQDHLKALMRKGMLESNPAKSSRRARGLIPKGFHLETVQRVPVYGEIAAGSAREAEQMEFGEAMVPDSISKNPSFALRVSGNSMVDVGILEGDVLIVEKGHRVEDGDIVVAMLDGEMTVKRFSRIGKDLFLVPENKEMKPIKISTARFHIQGKVVGLQRKL